MGAHGNSRGFGIENTKQRLKLLYGNQASFKIVNEDSDTVLTEIICRNNFNENCITFMVNNAF